MEYAILEAGGKQYLAREGETIEVDRMPIEVGAKVSFKEVLLLAKGGKIEVGSPLVRGARVEGQVVGQVKGRKIIVYKYKPKERYRRKKGHRQPYTRVAITRIAVRKPKAKKAEDKPAGEESGAASERKKTGGSKPGKSKAKSTKAVSPVSGSGKKRQKEG